MICHIGSGKLAVDKDIIGIFDLDGEAFSAINADFLRKAEKAKITESATDDLPRSFVLKKNREETKVVLSRLSSSALSKRTEMGIAAAEEDR